MDFCCCKKSKHVKDGQGKDVQIVSLRVTGVVDIGEKHATGVAKLPGNIYVLCKNPSSIVIHRDMFPFERMVELSLKDLEAPWDLASSAKLSCLYLTDCTTNCVYKMTSPTHKVSPWLKDIGYPHTLTVTSSEDQVLLLRFGRPSSLEIYGTDAVKVRGIQLPDEIEYPKHAVRTSGGNYVVSGKSKGSEAWGVFVINVGGKILRRLTQCKQQREPYHLAIDSADRLFVADCWDHRLLIVDAKLSRCDEVQSMDAEELRLPWRLHFVVNDDQVLVLQHDGKVGRGVALADVEIDEMGGEGKAEHGGKKEKKAEKGSEKEGDKEVADEGEEKVEEATKPDSGHAVVYIFSCM